MRKKNGIADTENIDSHNIFQFGSRKKIGISRRFSIKLLMTQISNTFLWTWWKSQQSNDFLTHNRKKLDVFNIGHVLNIVGVSIQFLQSAFDQTNVFFVVVSLFEISWTLIHDFVHVQILLIPRVSSDDVYNPVILVVACVQVNDLTREMLH